MIKAVRHTGIVVTEMDRALEFYRQGLGLAVVLDRVREGGFLERLSGHPGVRFRVVMLQAPDGNRIELFQFYSHPKPAPENVQISDVGCSHVAFAVDDVDKAFKMLSARGIRFNCPPQASPDGYAKVTFCHDPDGTMIELVQILDVGRNPYED